MATTTGIELGPDSCVLAGVQHARAGVADVRALHIIERDNWPGPHHALAAMLRAVRRGKGFPRRARVIAWGLSEPVSDGDPFALALVRPLTDAGFKVERVLTPPQALALLAASRPRSPDSGGTAWLSLNMHGAAIAIVRGTELLFARTFEWSYDPMAVGSKAQLLQRYSLISHLAPELRRGMTLVRDATGVTVDAAITCGDLPDLRSLTMPLIEELDLEVETLDSTEGLRAVGKAKAERFAESAPVMRLACGVAAAQIQGSGVRTPLLLRSAAAMALAAGLGWGAYALSTGRRDGPVEPARPAAIKMPPKTVATPPAKNPSSAQQAANIPTDRKETTSATAPVPSAPKAAATPLAPQPPVPVTSAPHASVPGASAPAQSTTELPRSTKVTLLAMGGSSSTAAAPAMKQEAAAAASRSAAPPASTSVAGGPAAAKPAPSVGARASETPAPISATSPANAPPRASAVPSANVPRAIPPRAPAASASATSSSATSSSAVPVPAAKNQEIEPAPSTSRRLIPLRDPLPEIESILIDQDRRLAIVDGGIVGVGDAIGPRVVLAIDRHGVVFREPSGLAIRVKLRGGNG